VNDGDSTGLVVAVLLVLILCGSGYWYFVLRKKGSSDA
jgi:cbb3-type cytochrome oxidase subunit 3